MKNYYDRERSITNLKMLGIEAVNEANSGHPGIVLGAASMAYALFSEHLYCNPKDPQWINRDRFFLSAGHGSALLYSLLYLSGYNITLDDLKAFRKLGSKTAGHPEYDLDLGIEATTGPLGQGLSMAIGCALTQMFLANSFNKKNYDLFNYYTYVICSDGDLQEGISQESISLAGHWRLNKLIVLYDSNDIQLDGPLNLSQSDNVKERFTSVNWNYLLVSEGHNFEKISQAISEAKKQDKPTLIEIKTIIGKDASKQGTSDVHGSPLQNDLINVAKNLNWNHPPFYVDLEVKEDFHQRVFIRGQEKYQKWQEMFKEYEKEYIDLAKEIKQMFDHKYEFKTEDFSNILTTNSMATRDVSKKVLDIISEKLSLFLGGSADLSTSTKSKGADDVFSINNLSGRNIMFGVREFAMAAISNGMLLQKMVRSFVSTFLIFSDYMKAAIRLAALMKIPNIFIFSHDSIAVGEDGPTHQPVEQLAMLRSIPNVNVFRPCDIKEVISSYVSALNSKNTPTIILLSRQNLPQITSSNSEKALKGGYIISNEKEKLNLILIATGSEVDLAFKVKEQLLKDNIKGIRIVSMPSTNVFDIQTNEYKEKILPSNIKKVSLEMATTFGWHKYVDKGLVIGIDDFGFSGPMKEVVEKVGFTVENIVLQIKKII